MSERLMVRSYRRVFRIDRRLYRVDRWALPVPGGVPLRGVVYFAAALLAVLALGGLPVVGAGVAALSVPVRAGAVDGGGVGDAGGAGWSRRAPLRSGLAAVAVSVAAPLGRPPDPARR